MSQHVYQLKFSIRETYEGEGNLDMDMDGAGTTREDFIKAQVEKRIKEAIPTVRGGANVLFDSLVESE